MKFSEQLELIKQYNDGRVTFLEFVRGMQLDAAQLDAVLLLQAAHTDMGVRTSQLAQIMDDMVEKQAAGLSTIPKLVY